MLFDPKNLVRLLWVSVAALVMAAVTSCSYVVQEDAPANNDRLQAENSAFKKRLPLIERENNVLRKENQQQKAKIQVLENRTAQLTRKLADDEEQIKKLLTTEHANATRIEALLRQNADIAEYMDGEIRVLSERIIVDQDVFELERAVLLKEHADREADLFHEINDLKAILAGKESELSTLNHANAELSTRLLQANALAEEYDKARYEAVAEVGKLKYAITEVSARLSDVSTLAAANEEARRQAMAKIERLNQTIAKLSTGISDLSALAAEHKKAVDEKAAEIEELKAKNKELNRKMVEINHLLSEQTSPHDGPNPN